MRVLVLADKVLSRKLGDGLRVFGFLQHLSKRHQFDLICFSRPGETLEPDLRRVFGEVTLIPAPLTQRAPLHRRLIQSVSGKGFKLTSNEMRTALERALASGLYDVILEEAANTLENLPEPPLGIPLIVDSIDEPLLRELRAIRNAPWGDRPHYIYRAWRFWQYEKLLMGSATQNIYVSEVDARLYRGIFPGRPAAVVPNGVDTEYFAPASSTADSAYVVFEGNMNFRPNIDTAQRLVNEILPRLSERIPEVRIGIIGREPAPEVRRLASDRVEVTGTVPDIRPYLARATVFACPMRMGSGIKNKILQSWAMARPVVATAASLGGLSAHDEVNILVRDEPSAFADAVAELIVDKAKAVAIGSAGRATAETEYSWRQRAEELERLIQAAVDATGRPATSAQAGTCAESERSPLASVKSG